MNDFDNKVKEIIKFISKSDKKIIKNKISFKKYMMNK